MAAPVPEKDYIVTGVQPGTTDEDLAVLLPGATEVRLGDAGNAFVRQAADKVVPEPLIAVPGVVRIVHVRNLGSGVSNEMLKLAFSRFGNVTLSAVLPPSGPTTEGFVEFDAIASAQRCIEETGKEHFLVGDVMPVRVDYARLPHASASMADPAIAERLVNCITSFRARRNRGCMAGVAPDEIQIVGEDTFAFAYSRAHMRLRKAYEEAKRKLHADFAAKQKAILLAGKAQHEALLRQATAVGGSLKSAGGTLLAPDLPDGRMVLEQEQRGTKRAGAPVDNKGWADKGKGKWGKKADFNGFDKGKGKGEFNGPEKGKGDGKDFGKDWGYGGLDGVDKGYGGFDGKGAVPPAPGADKGAFFAKGNFPGGPDFAKGGKPGDQKGKGPMGKMPGKW
jgi:hypothetical protein